MPKTNKSYTKRLKITKSGQTLARKGGQNHFRSRKTTEDKMDRKRLRPFKMKPKAKQRFLS